MEILEMATAIGLRIKETPEAKRYENAKNEYEANKEINMALMEYEIQQQIIERQKKSEEFDAQLIENVNERIDVLYKTITEHPLFVEFESAQTALNELIKSVNQTIVEQITGKKPAGCTHDCSSCGGCS